MIAFCNNNTGIFRNMILLQNISQIYVTTLFKQVIFYFCYGIVTSYHSVPQSDRKVKLRMVKMDMKYPYYSFLTEKKVEEILQNLTQNVLILPMNT